MTSRQPTPGEKAQPALIVTHGNTSNKYRPMRGDTMILGRARGCDLRLEAPDISDVHCVVTRRQDGLHIRDCNSRTGTRLNGEPVQDAVLQDTDVLQIGLFSFEVSVPPGTGSQTSPISCVADTAEPLLKLQRARRRLVELALALRRRLRLERTGRLGRSEQALARRQADLDRLNETLRSQLDASGQRARQLEQTERDLARDRAGLDQERAAVQDARKQLTEQQALLEEVQARCDELQHRCEEAERELAEFAQLRAAAKEGLQEASAGHDQSVFEAELQEQDVRKQRTKDLTRYLIGTRLPLKQSEQQPAVPAGKGPGPAAAAQAAAAGPGPTQPWQPSPELQAMLVDLQKQLKKAREENEQLRQQLTKRPEPTPMPPAQNAELERLRQQMSALSRQVADKDARLKELAEERQAAHLAAKKEAAVDVESYEAELTEFRRQLELDRQAVDDEMRQVQERKAELDETVRNEELQLSRERAQLARERVQLDQMRDMLRVDLERSDREGEVRKRLAGLQRQKN